MVKCASGGGECRYMRHANVNVPSLATSHHPNMDLTNNEVLPSILLDLNYMHLPIF